MRIVEAMGIPVAHTSFHIFDGVPAIISERYDRIVSANGTVTALHQEDFTQALGIPSSLKYEEHNGPTSNAYAEMLRKHGLPGQAESNIRAFTDGILASYLVGATDRATPRTTRYCSMARPCGLPRSMTLLRCSLIWGMASRS